MKIEISRLIIAVTISGIVFSSYTQASCDISFNVNSDLTIIPSNITEIFNGTNKPAFNYKHTSTIALDGSPVPVSALENLANNVEMEILLYIISAKTWVTRTLPIKLTGTGNDVISSWIGMDADWGIVQFNSISYVFNNGHYVNANAWWCRPDVSAGTEQTGIMSVAGQGKDELLSTNWGGRYPTGWSIKTSPTVTWMETPAIDISVQTPVLDFGTAYTGIPARRELKYTVTSNVISGVVDVTYRTANIIGDARVKVLGTTDSNTEQIITNVTKNDATQITRFVEVTAPEDVTGEYNGTLTIDINIP